MYKLYDYDVHTLIDQSENEADIIDTMGILLQESIGQRFLIKYYDKKVGCDDTFSIKNVRDYYNYVVSYNERLKQKSCTELKKDILNMQPKSKVKTKGTRKI